MPLDPIAQRRLEAAALLLAAVAAYGHLGFSWGIFAACFFLPDLSILLYGVGPRVGGAAYNLAHFYLWPVLLGALAVLGGVPAAGQAALLWAAHIAFDRALGWGLKTEQSFCHTDMGLKTLPFPVRFLEPQGGAAR